MADEFDRKPGSRDGKPNKSTRRNGALSGHKLDTITVQGYREQPADPATGMVPGVTYSVNKGKRWELVEQLKQQSLEDKAEQAANGLEKEDGESVVVIESHLGSKTRREAESEAGIHGWSRRHNGEFQRSEKEPEVIQTRRGPEVKQNVRKAQFNKGVSDNAYDPDRVYLVTHEPGPKEIRAEKSLHCDGGPGGFRLCNCSYCTGKGHGPDPRCTKTKQTLEHAGL